MRIRTVLRASVLPLLLAGFVAGCAATGGSAPGTSSSEPSASSPLPPPERVLPERPLPHPLPASPAFERALEAGTRTERGVPGPRYWQQEAAYDITARLLPEDRRLEGTALIRYTNNSPDALDVLVLELAQNMHRPGALRYEEAEVTGGVQLERVVYERTELHEGRQDGPRYVVRGTRLGVVPAEPVAPGATVELAIDWHFTIPQRGAGARMGYSEDDLFFLAYWYPIMAVYDDVEGWDTDPFTGGAEFYADFADYDLTIEAPEGWVVWSTGELQNADEVLAPAVAARMRQAHASDEPVVIVRPDEMPGATARADGGYLRWRFRAEDVRDVAFSAVSNHTWDAARAAVGDRDGDGRTDYTHINTFWRADAPYWDDVTRYQQHAITYLSELTGLPYPWPHMTAVEGGGIIGGGMEFPMMTLMGDYNTRGDSALYYVTAHELAHMWIPLIVSSNERRYSWLDEGATTFAENEARADFFPGPFHWQGDQDRYVAVARAGQEGEMMRRSDHHYPGPAFGVASYQKPASVMRALQGVLGDETFFEAYRAFVRDWAFKHPYPQDFFNTFERVSGRDLDWFWYPWYYVTWQLDQAVARVEPAQGRTRIVVEDRGQVPMPVLLRITLQDGTVLNRRIDESAWLRGEEEATLVVSTDAVARVEIDPDHYFPDVDRDNNVWER